ncbi:MAG: hypothetical protein ACI4F1_13600 [Bariatricus sp.]
MIPEQIKGGIRNENARRAQMNHVTIKTLRFRNIALHTIWNRDIKRKRFLGKSASR